MNTLFIGQNLIRLSKVDSTNTFASQMISEASVPEGTIIIAEEQTHGKGQRGAVWQSEFGKNLTLSIVLKPTFLRADMQFKLSKAITLAVADFIILSGANDVTIKWPNDILINHQKVAGILIENQIKNSYLSCSILGLGININQNYFAPEIFSVTSLSNVIAKEFDLQNCLVDICECIERRYLSLRSGHNFDLEYLKMLYKFEERAMYEAGGMTFFGTIKGINEEGRLQILTDEEVLKSFDLKEIKFIRT
jgi:BirA family transcriptional regulator, biotin operon repressor / biotin---[acetyl-CoA-carboxylase] ligase